MYFANSRRRVMFQADISRSKRYLCQVDLIIAVREQYIHNGYGSVITRKFRLQVLIAFQALKLFFVQRCQLHVLPFVSHQSELFVIVILPYE